MARGFFIVGTDTDVGKTIVTAGILYVLRNKEYNATYFKAALSGALELEQKLIPGDTKLVSEVSNLDEAYENITPYVYKNAVSPHLAAILEDKPIDLAVIKEKCQYLKGKYDYIIAEGSGGIVCPLIDAEGGVYTIADLVKDLNFSVVIVARAGVGTINHTFLTVRYIETLGIHIKGIIINNYEATQVIDDNIRMIEKLTKIPIIAKFRNISNYDDNLTEAIREEAKLVFDAENIISCMEEL